MLLQCLKNVMELTVWQVYSIVNLHTILVKLLPNHAKFGYETQFHMNFIIIGQKFGLNHEKSRIQNS